MIVRGIGKLFIGVIILVVDPLIQFISVLCDVWHFYFSENFIERKRSMVKAIPFPEWMIGSNLDTIIISMIVSSLLNKK